MVRRDEEKDAKDYKEFQFGWLLFAFTIPAHILITYLYLNNLGDRPIGHIGFGIATVMFILIYFLFYDMTTKISKDIITITFGIGLIKKRIAIKRIRNVETTTTPWYYGYGIRYIPKGILYNIRGSHGVELNFKDSERVVRIGTKDSTKLKKEILRRLA